MAGKKTTGDEDRPEGPASQRNTEALARWRQRAAASKAAAHEWALQLNGHTTRTVPALLVWAHHAHTAGQWTAKYAHLSTDAEQPEEEGNVDYIGGAQGAIWRSLADAVYQRTGHPLDGVSLEELAIMAECGSAIQGRDDLKAAYREFVAAVDHLDVDALIAGLRERYPVAAADLPRPPVDGEWSIWMNKRDVEELLSCDGRHFDTLYPGEIERRGRERWRIRLDVRDEEVRRRYRGWLRKRGQRKQ